MQGIRPDEWRGKVAQIDQELNQEHNQECRKAEHGVPEDGKAFFLKNILVALPEKECNQRGKKDIVDPDQARKGENSGKKHHPPCSPGAENSQQNT